MHRTQTELVLFFYAASLVSLLLGHGRLMEPPSRASMWRQGYKTPVNYEDNQLYCGGVHTQYTVNNGKCGVCGDPYNGPREHEVGGKYATGTIVRKYKVGDIITVHVELTANHKGYFEFRLCPLDQPNQKTSETCLEKHLLQFKNGMTRYYVKDRDRDVQLQLRLPDDVKCKACMLQWKYNAGNSWGTSPNGTSCVGCGNQEQFYGCSDIAIGYHDIILNEPYIPSDEKNKSHNSAKVNTVSIRTGLYQVLIIVGFFLTNKI